MRLLDFFRNRKENPLRLKQANAILYPDKIVIVTIDLVSDGFGITSRKVTVLPPDSSAELIGSTVRHHLRLSTDNLKTPAPQDLENNYKAFLELAGFRNGKEYHKEALQLLIEEAENSITLYPHQNGGWTGKNSGFSMIENKETNIEASIPDKDFGDKIRLAWTMCE